MDQGIVNRTVCFNFDGNCCSRSKEVQVKNCNGHFIYNLPKVDCCNPTSRYCADPVGK